MITATKVILLVFCCLFQLNLLTAGKPKVAAPDIETVRLSFAYLRRYQIFEFIGALACLAALVTLEALTA